MEMPRLNTKTLDGLSDADRWLGYQQLRHIAEFKAGSIAVHWRGLSELDAEDLRARVLLGWRPIAEHNGLDLLDFDGGVEIRPAKLTRAKQFLPFSAKSARMFRLLIWETTPPTNLLSGPCVAVALAPWYALSGGALRRNYG